MKEKPFISISFSKNDIHANIDIAGFTHKKSNHLLREQKSSATYDFSSSAIKKNTLEIGKELFSYQRGYFDKDKHKYNLVGEIGENKESIVPRLENLKTLLPSNETFVIQEFLKDVALTGADKKVLA